MKVKIDKIRVGLRKRKLGDLAELKKSMSELGLLQPIVLNTSNTLVAGAHRLQAAKELEWDEIEATIVSMTPLEIEIAEIDENLIRNELSVLERGEQLARRKEIYEEQYPETKHGAVGGWNSATKLEVAESATSSFTQDVQDKTGISDRVVREDIQIANKITPEVKQAIYDTPLENKKTDLLKIARMPEEKQKQIVEEVVSGHAKNVDEAKRNLDPLFTSNSEEWYTPSHIIDSVIELFGEIDLDPCSNSKENPNVKAGTLYTQEDNGLSKDWSGKVYMNPPYGRVISEWVSKVVSEYEKGNTEEAILLVPARTDTAWMRKLRKFPRCYVSGRLKFSDSPNAAPFPNTIVYIGENTTLFIDSFSKHGDIYGLLNG